MATSEETQEASSNSTAAVASKPVKKRAVRKKASAGPQATDSSTALSAADLASLCLDYRFGTAPGRTLQISHAGRLASLQSEALITIEGRLLPRQSSQLDIRTGSRDIKTRQRAYALARDDSVRLRVGSDEGQPHIECKVYLEPQMLAVINGAIGKAVRVQGVFRCTFRDSGIRGPVDTPDAHLFEINPVTSLAIEGETVIRGELPTLRAASVESWSADETTVRNVRYHEETDTLTFTGSLQHAEYVQIPGVVLDGGGTSFVFIMQQNFVQLRLLPGSPLSEPLEKLGRNDQVVVSGLYGIDLNMALTNQFQPNILVLEVSDRIDVTAPGVRDVPSEVDLLGFQPLIDGLYALLNDEDTTLPITIGITAPWGAGKSSAMLQLSRRLGSHPYPWSLRVIARLIQRFPRAPSRVGLLISVIGSPVATLAIAGALGLALRPRWFVVNFDAWKYETSQAIWTALAKKIYDDARSEMTYLERMKFRFMLEYQRLDLGRFLVRGLGPGVLLAALSALVGWLSRSIPRGPLIAGPILIAVGSAGWNWGLLGDPFKRALDAYARRPTGYEFSPEAEHDVRTFTRVLTRDMGRNLAVFVDDLDRCSNRSVVAVVEAVNQIFNADQEDRCVFVLGMDREMVVTGVEVAYEQTVSYLRQQASPRATRFGESFLAKIVQLSVQLPKPDSLAELMDSIMPSPVNDEPTKVALPGVAQATAVAEERPGGAATSSRSPEAVAIESAQRAALLRASERVTRLKEQVRSVTRTLTEYMDPNPRALKRFVNAFRLQLHVANLMHIDEIDLGYGQLIAFAKWTLLRLQWPELAGQLDSKDHEFLEKLETQARRKSRRAASKGEPAEPAYRWLDDERFVGLISYGDEASRISALPVESLLRTN